MVLSNSFKAVIIVLITVLAYIPAIQSGFIWDDDAYIIENPLIKSADGLKKNFFDPVATPQYYPLVYAGFWLEYHLWGLWASGYHITNILLHILSAVILWRILIYLNISGAWLIAAVFALHPVHVESVAWITERKNVLSGVFYLLSMRYLLLFFNIVGDKEYQVRQWQYYGLGFFLFLCALLSKTVTCSLPAAILLILWWKRGKIFWREISMLAPFFLIGIGMGLLTAWIERHHVGAYGIDWTLSFMERCLIAGRALWFYAGKLAFPTELIFIYPRWKIDVYIWWQYIYPLGILLVLLIFWNFRTKIGRAPMAAVLFFCGTLFPALGFIDVYPFIFSYVADHFQYFASIGLIVLTIGGLTQMLSKLPARMNQIASILGAILLIFYWIQTWNQSHNYKDLETLWSRTLQKNPEAWIAHTNLGNIRSEQGRIEEAIAHYEKSLAIKPNFANTHIDLGIVLNKIGKFEEAMFHYKQALKIKPNSAEAFYTIGITLSEQGKLQEAIAQYSEAIRINPNFVLAHNNIGIALNLQGNTQAAVSHFYEAIRINPDFAEAHYNLGLSFDRQGKISDAVTHYLEVIRINPNYAEAYNNLGTILHQQGKLEKAITLYMEAIRIKPDDASVHYNLGTAFIGLKKYEQALLHLSETIRISPDFTAAHKSLEQVYLLMGKNNHTRRIR